ncbi:hypothetical protein LSH36_195g03068 [Paralvinella palmiformis]|uniref:Uncharacterized protein n=1 Tax=Paralvinella palmiformis TaxID=53620 RepID=A0AAD9JRD8_9ANNE|nr:hypothetical protein LSH36_195g03068 [Paralvinella palmiformis]
MKVKRRSEKKETGNISFISPIREMRLNISSSSLNTTNLADCYDFDLEDEDCRKKLNLSKNATKKKSAEKKVKATTRKKGGSLQSKQRTQKTNLKKKLVSKSVKTSDKCAEPLAVNVECRGNIPVLAGGQRETDSVKKNNKTTHAAGVGVLVSPFHNISKIDPVVVIERITSTPSVAKLGQTSFNNQLKPSRIKETRKPSVEDAVLGC